MIFAFFKKNRIKRIFACIAFCVVSLFVAGTYTLVGQPTAGSTATVQYVSSLPVSTLPTIQSQNEHLTR